MFNKQKSIKLAAYLMFLLFPVMVIGQQAAPKTESKKTQAKAAPQKESKQEKTEVRPEEKKAGTYLDKIHARRNVLRLKKENFENIKRVKAMVANFGDSSDQSKFDKIQSEYIQGMKYLYERKSIEANNVLKKNEEELIGLMESLSAKYKEKATQILARCASELVEAELGEMDRKADEVSKNMGRIIDTSKGQLLIAYDQFDLGNNFETDKRFEHALIHFRIAKEHGIHILIRLKLTENEKESVRNEFKVDLSDSNNQSFGG
ncbi:MAG: hypothetical protein OEZ22_00115 [Spirochaetia bacterium]|nr:hypothetical protein [Spirochaetia bacterium]